MSARIARGSRGKAPARKSTTKATRSRHAAESTRRIGLWLLMGMVIALALGVAAALRVPQMIGHAAGEAVGDAGFQMKHVEVRGAKHVPWLAVQNVTWDQDSLAMPLVDLGYTRERLLRFGWVKEARVSRRWPDTVLVDIVERQPAAIWQHNRQLALIDNEGVVLEQVRLNAMPDLPLIIGPAANRKAGELERLLGAAPALKPMMAGASWIGGRRWDIRFQSGEVLALPEGEEAARKALVKFQRMDQSAQLLGRGLVRFDMRLPGQFTVRVSREPGSTVPVIEPTVPAASDAAKTI